MAGRPRKNAAKVEEKPIEAPAAKPKRTYTRRSTKQSVKFELTTEQAQNAETVSVAGEFNNWDKNANPLNKTLEGKFEVEIELEKGKSYQFRYVLNGTTWINDPYRKSVDNGRGELNSIVEL